MLIKVINLAKSFITFDTFCNTIIFGNVNMGFCYMILYLEQNWQWINERKYHKTRLKTISVTKFDPDPNCAKI